MSCAICIDPVTEGSHLCAMHHATMYFDWTIRFVPVAPDRNGHATKKIWKDGQWAWKYSHGERFINGKWVRLDAS